MATRERYVDEKGKPYVVEFFDCCEALGRGGPQHVHILYDDGLKAVIRTATHENHHKIESPAQSPAKLVRTGRGAFNSKGTWVEFA